MIRDLSICDEPNLPPRCTHGDGGNVQPRTQALEDRMRNTPDPERRQGGNSNSRNTVLPWQNNSTLPPPSNNPDTNNLLMMTISNNYPTPNFEHRNKENTNDTAIVLHSPILASIYNSNIKQFEADVLKRQADYTNRISDLEGRLAIFHSRLAVESAERGREHAFTMEEYIDGPIEQAMRRSLERITTDFVVPIMDPKYATNVIGPQQSLLAKEKDGSNIDIAEEQGESLDASDATDNTTPADPTSSTLPNLVSVERLTNHLEDQMNDYKHITLVQARRKSFDDIEKTCRQTLQPTLVLEITKANKREGGVVRRFESNAGEHTRLVAEMIASRASSLGHIKIEVDGWETTDSTLAECYLEEIQRLKQHVVELREERMRQDDMVVEKIVQDKKALEEGLFSVCS